MPAPIARPARLRADLDAVREHVQALSFALAVPEQQERRRVRDHVIRSIETHLESRLRSLHAPLIVAVFGPTGSGKSTITNTLAGRQISRSGVLRPTTREAVVWCHTEQADLVRSSALAASGPIDIVADDHPLLRDLIIVDTPDIDSIAVEHRRQTERILLMADAAIAITTPQRYADAVPWELLGELTARAMPMTVVMNRMHRRSAGAVTDLVGLLRDHGVGEVHSTDDVLTIQEQRVRSDGRLASSAVKRLAGRLDDLAERRSDVIEEGVSGAVRLVVRHARTLGAAVEHQADDLDRRWSLVEQIYRGQLEDVERHLSSGDLVRGEVVERWRRLIGVGDLSRIIARGASRVRDVMAPRRLDEHASSVGAEARDELVAMAIHRVGRAEATAVAAWELDGAGIGLLDTIEPFDRTAVEDLALIEIDAWMSGLIDLIGSQGKSRFRIARVVTLGVNATATLLLLGVFASTGGLTGGEVGVVAGTAAAQQTILEHVLGSATAGRLAQRARKELVERFEVVLLHDAERFRRAAAGATDERLQADRLRSAAFEVEQSLEDLFGG